MNNNPHSEVAGRRFRSFTLLELMLAIGLLLILVSMLLAAIHGITLSWQKISRKREQFREVLKIDRTLDTVLSNIVPFTWPNDERRETGIFQGRSDQLDFAYRHTPNNLQDGALRFAQLRVENEQLVMFYQERPLIDGTATPALRRSVLAKGVARIDCLYADWSPDSGLEWVDIWNLESDRDETPLAVLVWVHWLDGRWECWLRRTAGSGHRERWGNWLPPKT